MNDEEIEKTSKKLKIFFIIGFSLLITGISLLIYSVVLAFQRERNDHLLTPGFTLTFFSMALLFTACGARYHLKALKGETKTLGIEAEYERYEKIIQEKSKPQTIRTNRSEIKTSSEKVNGEQVVKIRCRLCGALNDEDAQYCDQCAQPL